MAGEFRTKTICRRVQTTKPRLNKIVGSTNKLAWVAGLLACSLLVVSCGCGYKKEPKSTGALSKASSDHGNATGYSLAEYAGSASPTFLDQKWSADQRDKFYTTSQGSQMMPLSWFMALEQPTTKEPFLSDGLIRFGYLPNQKGPLNPCGLPVGFTIDPTQVNAKPPDCPTPSTTGTRPFYWVGITCAACHTGRVNYHGTTLQIDGAPTNADLFKLLAEIDSAVQSTLKDDTKFNRFAERVAGTDPKRRHDLRNELTRFSAYFGTLVNASTPAIPWGPARTDAFGMIFNRVSGIDLSDATGWQPFHALESNNASPDAPVSYPFLWGTSKQDYVQWNGVAPNTSKYSRLIRNVVEALGVFGRVNIQKPHNKKARYTSTVNLGNQVFIEEELISNLRSPQWPSNVFGALKESKIHAGKVLYRKYCLSCHTIPERASTALVRVCASPLAEVGTDPAMATNVGCRKVDTGVLEGSPRLVLIGKRLEQNDFVLHVAGTVGVGALLDGGLSKVQPSVVNPFRDTFGRLAICAKGPQVRKPSTLHTTTSPMTCMEEQEVYRARPLDGIWATAPYLHNGSVPSLYQLLLPGKERVTKFYVGSREFDPNEVGFEYHSGPFEFDTGQPGNSKNGHEYGTDLSADDRQALLEYLKTL